MIMSDKENKEHIIKIGVLATQAAWWVLTSMKVQGRTNGRLHSKACKALKKECIAPQGDEEEVILQGNFVGGKMTIKRDPLDFLVSASKAKFDEGVPGNICEGLTELLDTVEDYLDDIRLAEKAKSKDK